MSDNRNPLILVEAAIGFEPMNNGFAVMANRVTCFLPCLLLPVIKAKIMFKTQSHSVILRLFLRC